MQCARGPGFETGSGQNMSRLHLAPTEGPGYFLAVKCKIDPRTSPHRPRHSNRVEDASRSGGGQYSSVYMVLLLASARGNFPFSSIGRANRFNRDLSKLVHCARRPGFETGLGQNMSRLHEYAECGLPDNNGFIG